jgi:hypothetical protein
MRAVIFLLLVLYSCVLLADDAPFLVKVSDPYIEVHTGPGRGYPIFYTVARGEWVQILFRQTDWYKIKTESETEGWVSAAELAMTLNPSGERVDIKDPGPEDFRARNWEYGVLMGDFEGAAVITAYGAYHFTENISTEILISQATGNASNNTLLGVQLVHQTFPEWTVSPFVALGTGFIHVTPKSTIASTENRTDQYANYSLGIRMHVTKRFLLRVEYTDYIIFTDQNENEEVNEWKAGFGFFF